MSELMVFEQVNLRKTMNKKYANYLIACTTLNAPKRRPDSVPPWRVYKASVALCIAGLKPNPKDPTIAEMVNWYAFCAIAMKKYEITSTSSEHRARLRSKEGNSIVFRFFRLASRRGLASVWVG